MAEFVIFKLDGGPPGRPISIVQADTATELREVVKQGYDGPGRYAVCRWDNRREFDLKPGAVNATDPP